MSGENLQSHEKLGGTKQVIRLYHCIIDKNCDSAPVLSFGHCAVFQLQHRNLGNGGKKRGEVGGGLCYINSQVL